MTDHNLSIFGGDLPDENALAEAILVKLGDDCIFNHRSGMYRFDFCWKLMHAEELREHVRQQLKSINQTRREGGLKAIPLKRSLVQNVAALIETVTYKANGDFNLGDPTTIGVRNGDLVLTNNGWQLKDPVKHEYRLARLSVEYDPKATAPVFCEFMDAIFEGEEDALEKQNLLLAMFGYAMQTRSHLEKFVFLVGNGANGKSVALNVLKSLLGTENIAAIHPSRLANAFDRAELDQKFANIVSESEHGLKLPAAELKALISGESMTVSRKHQQLFTLNPFATFFWATNHLPNPSDFSDALYRRTFILEFNHQFNGERRDVNLFDKLKRERQGILNMCLKAYADVERSGFDEPTSSVRARAEWRRNADQVACWLNECTAPDLCGELLLKEAYAELVEWAAESGVRHVVTRKTFAERLENLGVGKKHTNCGTVLTGLRLG